MYVSPSVQYTAIKSVACSLFPSRIGKRYFRYKNVTIWNVIFEDIYVDIEIGTFERHLNPIHLEMIWRLFSNLLLMVLPMAWYWRSAGLLAVPFTLILIIDIFLHLDFLCSIMILKCSYNIYMNSNLYVQNLPYYNIDRCQMTRVFCNVAVADLSNLHMHSAHAP